MSDGTKISWTDASWPVMTGCTHLSEGCNHCYAAKLTSGRLKHLPAYEGLAEHGMFNGQVRLLPDRLDWPLHWRKPRKIFVADMGDLFHDGVPDRYIARVFGVMARAPQHTFQVLTKRHSRMRSLLNNAEWVWSMQCAALEHGFTVPGGIELNPQHIPWPLPNVWLGVSAENQRWADIRIPALLDTPAAIRFVSAEPLLGPIRMRASLMAGAALEPRDGINWVIAGGESGPGHREMDPGWLESIVTQCRNAGTAVWVKQDSGPRAGQQGRIPDDLWIQEFPNEVAVPA